MSRDGAYLGSVRNVVTLRERCVIDAETGCWCLRTARGRRQDDRPPHKPLKVHVYGRGQVQARRAAWEFQHREPPPADKVVTVSCGTSDCVRPAHLLLLTTAEMGALMRQQGRTATAAKRRAALANTRSRSSTRLTDELAQWARESPQVQADVAHALGCRQQAVSDIRRGVRWRPPQIEGASVFALGTAANAQQRREAA